MRRAGSFVAIYVRDYGDVMEFLTYFRESAIDLEPGVAEQHEARRFPGSNARGLAQAFARAGLGQAVIEPITIQTRFDSCAD